MPRPPRPLRLIGALVLSLCAPAAAAPCPTRASWPTAGFPDAQEKTAAVRAADIAALQDFAFRLVGTDEERRGPRTDAVLIIKDGALIYERYARGYTAKNRHYTWSMAKSVTNAFAGLAAARGALHIDDSVCAYVPTLPVRRCDITIRHLLEFSSGLDWRESYENQSNQVSSVLAMLYGEGRRDMMAFVAGHPSRDPPGETFMYSSGDATFLMGVVDRALRGAMPPAQWPDYDARLLFDVLGMGSALFERDTAGTPVGSSFFYATPRDLAKFGYFYLNDGCWAGGRLLPEGWVRDSVAVSPPFRRRPLATDPGDVQGRQFWLNRPVPEQGVAVPWPDVPQDAYAARGHWGQSITVVPSRGVVIVRLADDREPGFDFNRFLALALQVAQ